MAAGKSKAAKRAADRLGGEALDTDSLLEADLGEPIAQFFDREGESAFREREEKLVLDLLDRPDVTALALGGGAVESERVRAEASRRAVRIYRDRNGELAWRRAGGRRPLRATATGSSSCSSARTPLYESVARAVITSTKGEFQEGSLDAAAALGEPSVPSTVRMAWARTGAGQLPGVLRRGRARLCRRPLAWRAEGLRGGQRACSVAPGRELAAALASADLLAGTITVPPGEPHKTLGEAERVLRELAKAGMERSDAVVALGGGVTGDLAGFCAAVYQRGVGVVQVPTTLVAQVDSAYGGKTGVDLPEAKNYVGSFHQPAAVLTDPLVLSTLPERELQAGFAEVLKTALISGGTLWERMRSAQPFAATLADDPRPPMT